MRAGAAVEGLVAFGAQHGLVRGQVGTVVESWDPGLHEVEFSDGQGRTYAMVAVPAGHLMRLHHEPVLEAA